MIKPRPNTENLSEDPQPKVVADLNEIHNAFIRNVSHELRTPLAVLMGYADLLYHGELGAMTPEQEEAMFIIVNRAQELKKMVTRISTLLAVKARQTVKHPLALAAMVAQMAEAQRTLAADNGLTFKLEMPPNLPNIIGDAEQLQMAIECLIENSIKFTQPGGRVTVQLWSEAGWVNVMISDTGIGIEENEMARLFQPFQQADDSPSRAYGGLGLGLTLARDIVAAHAGKIEVKSQPGQGTCFTVKLPSFCAPDEACTVDARNIPKRRILIVDDEEFVAFTLREGLEKLPHCEVEVTMSGLQALKLFEEHPYDLLVTDYKMPDLNGVLLASQIRQQYPSTGIIMMTAYNHDLIQEPSAAASIQRVLNKPVKLTEIRDVALETLAAHDSLRV